MRRIFVLFTFVVLALRVHAQQDSIQVVIECDSLYRPFLKKYGYININESGGVREKKIKVDNQLKFNIPKPVLPFQRNTLLLSIEDFGNYYFESIFISYSRFDYGDARIESQNDTLLVSNIILFEDDAVINIFFPNDCKHNKYLIDNTCPHCSRQDSVSWLQYGFPIENPITGKLDNERPFFNPYSNPFILPNEFWGCEVGWCQPHWYCHRCKREY